MTFVELLTVRNIPFRRRSKPGEVWVPCPFCREERFRLGLNYARNLGHCFNCGWKSRRAVQSFLREIRLDVQIEGIPEDIPEGKPEPVRLPDDFTPLWTLEKKDETFYDARRYLEDRGVPEWQMKEHRIGASYSGRFAYRVIFPVVYQGKLAGLVARDFSGRREPKYLNSMGQKAVYNLRRRKRFDDLILSEGCLKALAIERATERFCSGALLGSAVTDEQIEMIYKAGHDSVILWSDPDRAGKLGTAKIAQAFAESGFWVRIVWPVPSKQADEHTTEEVREFLRNNIVPFTWAIQSRLRL